MDPVPVVCGRKREKSCLCHRLKILPALLELAPAAKRLDIHLDFQKGSKFTCPECGAEGQKVHDTATKTWRHLNFFQYEAYLTARVPRVHCD